MVGLETITFKSLDLPPELSMCGWMEEREMEVWEERGVRQRSLA